MNDIAEIVGDAGGDACIRSWDWRARGMDLLFAPDRLGDLAQSARILAKRRWTSEFPGWGVYRTVVNGTDRYWLDLVLYSRGMGHALALSHSRGGKRVTESTLHGWVSQAAEDAMFRCVNGAFPQSAARRAELFGVHAHTYTRLRNTLAGGFIGGLESFRGVLWDCLNETIYVDRQRVA